ncbi:undecaprenyl-diphosphatase [Paenibacillus sp. KQZ6P-2]|uniref:Undecaprenyl-diphosphatase n=1 Tax=Paenibacillus mangrovi TaxID=2931978 RepID=A0A9X1WT88_9BACL|nr:undecaprenyl-diphosphatase [Paenibacillus mangrovi]MCJ8014902.1 undecaprenyl-diphosphatase [Paenibacillus mangrovi]
MSIGQLDYQLFQSINEWASSASFLNPVMIFLAKDAFYLFFIGLLVYWFTRSDKNRRMVVESAIATCVGLGISFILGHLFYRDRPFVAHTVHQLIDHAVNASFPSDHAIGAFAIATSIALFRKKDGIVWLILAGLIAFSRVWTGVHYPGDIVAGALIGVMVSSVVHQVLLQSKTLSGWVNACISFYEKWEVKIWPLQSKKTQQATPQEK